MPRGYNDYQNPVNQVAGRLVDFAGIQTAQLGVCQLDGLGRLVWLDKFGEGLGGWQLYTLGAGIIPAVTSATAEIPPSCLILGVAGGIAGDISGLQRSFLFTQPWACGVDFAVLYNQGNNRLDMNLYSVRSLVLSWIRVRYIPNLGTISIMVAGGTTVYLTLTAAASDRLWIPIKLVADFEAGTGKRLVVGTQSISLVDIPITGGPTLEPDQLYMTINAEALGAGSLNQYVGHVYLTVDEP